MKDYLLSEMKKICKKLYDEYGMDACNMCENLHYELEQFCIYKFEGCPDSWDNIEPRDVIYLPYKLYRKFSHDWEVVYFDNMRYEVKIKCFTAENEADEFIKELKGEKDV